MDGTADSLDPTTRRFLRGQGRSLPVLSDPSTATASPRPADAAGLLSLRTLARDVRQHTIDHLDGYVDAFVRHAAASGAKVHVARDAATARRLIAPPFSDGPEGRAFERREARPSGPPLNGGGVTVVGSPLADEIGLAASVVPGAAVAVVAAAFVVAETGQVCLATDDPDILTAAEAATLVCLAGIESVVPRVADLAIMLKLLARSASGRPMTAHTLLLDPGRAGRSLHVVLLDNGRSDLLATEFRPVLRCIGCGACTAGCPVYQAVDGVPSGLWAGPIGAITLPLLRPNAITAELPHASTLCGACADVCPVRIDLPAHLIALRARSPRRSVGLRLWGWIVLSPTRYRWATRLRWRRRREPWPPRAPQSFHDLWRQRRR